MTKKAVGTVEATNEDETSQGKKFGIKLDTEDGENWFNGFGSLPEGVTKGAKIQVPYELNESGGNIYRNIEDKDAIDILEEGEEPSSESSSSSSKDFDRQNAIKTAGQIFKGQGRLDVEELQQFKLLVEELDHYNQNGEWDNLDDIVAEELLDSKGSNQESNQETQQPEEEDSETSKEEESKSDSSEEEEEDSSDGEEVTEEDLKEEMNKAAKEASDEEVLFDEGEEEGDKE